MAQSARYVIALFVHESAITQSTAKYTIPKGRSPFSNLQKLIKTATRKILLGKVLLLVLKSAIAPPIVSSWFAIAQSTAFQEAIALLKP
jgi:hypothetical protein